jgi:AcrR family transcriptional regulator
VVVKGPTHRQRQALATKTQVADAARRLFADRGYVATTIAAIAEAADIPAPTIYSAFGTKAAILRWIADQAVSTVDPVRGHEQARTNPDPAAGLRQAANIQRRQFEAMLDIITVHQEAARTDPEIAEATRRILANRERGFRAHLAAIVSHLAPGMTIDDAVAVYTTLVLPEVYRSLVTERGWSPERYEQWLGGALIHDLLG